MVKMGVIRRLTAIVANLSLLLNSFLPFLLIAKPTYAQSPEIVVSKIVYDASANKLEITTNSTEKIAYQLFYKTPEKIDAIAGNDLNQANQSESFYLGTCSSDSICLSQKISRGILKIELDSKFISKLFTFENNVLTVVKEIESTQTDLTEEEDNFLENGDFTGPTLWTFEKVELNKEYVAPQNSGVKITFTKLPETSGNIKIEEITLTPEQIVQTGSLSDKAYDITSDMVDGTFAYNLSLPIPESLINENVEIKYAEDISEIELAQKVDETITNTDTSVSVNNLDHFTIFFAVVKTTDKNLVGKETFKKGETVYINTIVFDLSKTKIKINNSNGDVVKQYNETYLPAYQYIYTIKLTDSIGKYTIDIGSYQIVGGKWYNPKWGWVWENNVDNFDVVEGICNDGITDPNEQCDNGTQNGQICHPGYNSSCSYCNNSCNSVILNNFDNIPPVSTVDLSDIVKGTIVINQQISDDEPKSGKLQIWKLINGVADNSKFFTIGDINVNNENKIVYTLNTISNLYGDGSYRAKFTATDGADNQSVLQKDFIVDNTVPTATIDNVTPKSLYNNSTNISVHAIDNNYQKTELYRNNETSPFKTYTGAWFGLSWLTDGNYRMLVIDKADNSTEYSFTIDKTTPTATVNYSTTSWTNGGVTATIVPNESVTVTNNSGNSQYIFSDNGSFTFEFKDLAGNAGSVTATVNNIDKIAPTKPVSLGFKNPDLTCESFTNIKNITVDWADSTDNVAVLGYDYLINYPLPNGTRGNWNTFFTQSQYRGSLNEGLHNIKVRSKDTAGNYSEWTDLCGITYDSIVPTTIITDPVDSHYFNESVNILGFTEDINGVASVNLSYSPYINGVCSDTYIPITSIDGDSFVSFNWSYFWTPESEGSYCIKAAGLDIVGNIENSAIVKNIIFDKTISEVGISLNPKDPDASNGWYKTQPEITLTHTDTNFDKIEYQWDSQSNTGWNIYSNPFTLANEGAHILYYRAVDKASNISPVGIKNIKWDKTELELGPQNISANPNPTSGSTSKITWEAAKDNDGIDKYEVHWILNDSTESKSYSKTVGSNTFEVEIDQLIEGRWTVRVIAFDASGKSRDNSIDLIVDRTGPSAPVLSLTGTGTGTASLSWNTINDAKDYIIWYGNTPGNYLYGARVGNVTSYTVQGLGAGNYYFVIKSVDEAQNQSGYSNEVNTGNITGAAGTTPGQPAEGFAEEVLGEDTENNVLNPTPTLSSGGEVLGESDDNLFNWRWLLLLLLIPTYFIGRSFYRKE